MERDERIENKLDKMAEDITEIKVTLGKQHVVLVQHESRSTKLETIVAVVIKKVSMFEGALKVIGGLSILMGLIQAVKALVH